MPLPQLGYKTDQCVLLDFAWPQAPVGVAEELPLEDANTIGIGG